MSDGAQRGPDGKWLPGSSASPATQWKPGKSANPGGRYKLKKELIALARESVPDAFAVARQILLNEEAPNRDRLDAGKFLTAYGLGAPPKAIDEETAQRVDEMGALSVEELRALARQSLADDASKAESDADDDDSDGTEH